MPYELANAPPWGRSYQEYKDMFSLDNNEKSCKILGCADGPASFNYEATKIGFNVISVDPIYASSPQEIKDSVISSAKYIQDTVEQNNGDYNWNYIFRDPADLTKCRLKNMELFLADYKNKDSHNRYICGALPALPFYNYEFDITLVSNFLFLYDNYLDFDFHVNSIIELCRVSREVRIFPLTSTLGYESSHLSKIISYLNDFGYEFKKVPSNYTFIKIAKETLIVRKSS